MFFINEVCLQYISGSFQLATFYYVISNSKLICLTVLHSNFQIQRCWVSTQHTGSFSCKHLTILVVCTKKSLNYLQGHFNFSYLFIISQEIYRLSSRAQLIQDFEGRYQYLRVSKNPIKISLLILIFKQKHKTQILYDKDPTHLHIVKRDVWTAVLLLPSQPETDGLLSSDSGNLHCNLQRISQTPLWLASVPRDAKATSKEMLDYVRARIWAFWHGREEVAHAHAERVTRVHVCQSDFL